MSSSRFQEIMNCFDNEEEEESEDNNKTGSGGYFNQINNKINSDSEINDNNQNKEEEKNDNENLYESIEEDDENEENEKEENEDIYEDENDNNIYSSEESFKPTKPPSKSNLNNNSNNIKENINDSNNKKNNDDDDSFLAEQEKRRQERIKKQKEEEKINKLNEKNEKTKENLKKKKEQIEEMMKKKKEENLNLLNNNIKKDNYINNSFNNNDNNNEYNNDYIDDYNNNDSNMEIQKIENDNNNSKHSSISSNCNLEQKKERLEFLVKQKQNEKKKLEEERKIIQKNYENNSSKNSELNLKLSEKKSDNNLIKKEPIDYDNQPKIKNSFSSLNQKESIQSEKSKKKKKYSQNTIKNFFKPALYNNNSQFTFHPKIDKNSKKIVNDCIKKSNTYRTLNKSIDNILYEDAKRKEKKLKELKKNRDKELKLKSSKSKINITSHNIAVNNLEKKIEKTVKLYEKDGQISYIGIVKVLYDLKIFKEILKKDDYYDNKNNDMSEEEILEAIKNKYNHRRRNDNNLSNGISIEVDLLEQIWFLLNTSNQEYIDSNTFINFLIIIFSPANATLKEIVEILNKYIQAILFKYNDLYIISDERNSENSIKKNNLISKITGNYFSYQDKWELEKLISTFWQLKKNRISYIPTHHISKSTEKDIKERNKNLTFQPNYDSNNIPKPNFMKKLKKYEEEEQLKQFNLNVKRKERQKEEIKNLQKKPNIELSKISAQKAKYNFTKNNYENIHNELYNKALESILNKENKIKENQIKEEQKISSQCPFQPELSHSINLNKSFDTIKNIKGYGKFVERTRKGIIIRKNKKFQVTNIPIGEKYEEIKKRKIKPFNITDIRKKDKEEMKKLLRQKYNIPEDIPFDSGNESDGTTPYLMLDIHLSKKKMKKIKVYINDDPQEIAKEFGRNYGLNDSIVEKFTKYIEQFQTDYLINQNNDNGDILSS